MYSGPTGDFNEARSPADGETFRQLSGLSELAVRGNMRVKSAAFSE
jgi:hypothetical protein